MSAERLSRDRDGTPGLRGAKAKSVKQGDISRFTFPRSHRLLKRGDFLRLSRGGRRIQNTNFILCYAPGKSSTVRLGVTVTRKVGGAVKRNRIKRLCREYLRLQQHRFKDPWDINLIAKHQAAASENENVRQSLAHLLRHLMR